MNRHTAQHIIDILKLEAAIDDTLVTTDPEEARSGVEAGVDVLLLTPPRITYDTLHHAKATWTLYIVPGSSDRNTSWDDADQLLVMVRDVLAKDLTTVAPYDWNARDGGAPLIGYQATLETDHDL